MPRSLGILLLLLGTFTLSAFASEETPQQPLRDPLVIGATLVQRKSGCKIRALVDGGPAAKAGLQIGDVILKVNDHPAEKLELLAVVSLIALKNPVSLQVRDTTGKIKTISITKAPQSSLRLPSGKVLPTLPPDPLDELKPGDPAPLITAQYLDDKQITLADWRDTPVVVIFWAQWSDACVAELPALRDLYLKYHGVGLEFLGVNLDTDKVTLDKFRADKNIPWPQHFDGLGLNGGVVREWGVTAVPTITLIGRDGKIIAEDLHGPQLEAAVVAAIGPDAKYEKSSDKSTIRRPKVTLPLPSASSTSSSVLWPDPSPQPMPASPSGTNSAPRVIRRPRIIAPAPDSTPVPESATNNPVLIPATTEK